MIRKENAERYASIVESVLGGATWREAGETAGVSASRAMQVTHNVLRLMLSTKRLDEPFPDHDYWSVSDIRAHKDFWLRRLAKLRAELGG